MAENSKIQWTHHTFNPWRGCTKVSPGCTNCYAESMSKRNPSVLGIWGKDGRRTVASSAHWRLPVKWDRWAREGSCHVCQGKGWTRVYYGNTPGQLPCESCDGKGKVEPYRARVFCASLADVFEGPETIPNGTYSMIRNARVRLFELIEQTPNLDWLLLTKRPQNVMQQVDEVYRECRCIPSRWPLPNVWLGVSVEDRERKARIDRLREIPAAVRFLSIEPLLEDLGTLNLTGIHWVIVGGESGGKARELRPLWVRKIVKQCREQKAAPFVKQMGSNIVDRNDAGFSGDEPDSWPESLEYGGNIRVQHNINGYREEHQGADVRIHLPTVKGGEPEEWPRDLRVREFPVVN